MDTSEIKRRVLERIDSDDNFTRQLGDAITIGVWDVVAQLIADAVGYVVQKTSEFWAWLQRQFA